MELTIFEKFCMVQNLRAIFESAQLPDEIMDICDDYEDILKPKVSGTFLSDNLAFDEELVEDQVHDSYDGLGQDVSETDRQLIQFFISPHKGRKPHIICGQYVNKITRRGEIYRPITAKVTRDAYIVVRPSGREDWFPGQIQRIVIMRDGITQVFIVFKRLKHIDPNLDPLRRPEISFFDARHYQMKLNDTEELAPLSWITGHAILDPQRRLDGVSDAVTYVFALERVGYMLFPFDRLNPHF